MIKADPQTKHATVTIDPKMPTRTVKVAKAGSMVVEFKQDKDELSGMFVGPYSHLKFAD